MDDNQPPSYGRSGRYPLRNRLSRDGEVVTSNTEPSAQRLQAATAANDIYPHLTGKADSGNNAAIEDGISKRVATDKNATLPPRGQSPSARRSKRSADAAGLTASTAAHLSKRPHIEASTSDLIAISRSPHAATNPSGVSATVVRARSSPSIPSSHEGSIANSQDVERSIMSLEDLKEENSSLKKKLDHIKEAMKEQVTKASHNQIVAALKQQQQASQEQHARALADILLQQETAEEEKASIARHFAKVMQSVHTTAQTVTQVQKTQRLISQQIEKTEAATEKFKNDAEDAWIEEDAKYEKQELETVLQQDVPRLLSGVKEMGEKFRGIIDDYEQSPADVRDAVDAAGISESLYDAD